MTIGASYFVAMTVVPAYCARFLRSQIRDRSGEQPPDSGYGLYGLLLSTALRLRWLVILVTLGLVGASTLLLPRIGTELFPSVDAGTFEIRMKTIPGTRLEETEALVARVDRQRSARGGGARPQRVHRAQRYRPATDRGHPQAARRGVGARGALFDHRVGALRHRRQALRRGTFAASKTGAIFL